MLAEDDWQFGKGVADPNIKLLERDFSGVFLIGKEGGNLGLSVNGPNKHFDI